MLTLFIQEQWFHLPNPSWLIHISPLSARRCEADGNFRPGRRRLGSLQGNEWAVWRPAGPFKLHSIIVASSCNLWASVTSSVKWRCWTIWTLGNFDYENIMIHFGLLLKKMYESLVNKESRIEAHISKGCMQINMWIYTYLTTCTHIWHYEDYHEKVLIKLEWVT